jgi:hypothetical protein
MFKRKLIPFVFTLTSPEKSKMFNFTLVADLVGEARPPRSTQAPFKANGFVARMVFATD